MIFWWREPEYPGKTTYLPYVTDKLLYRLRKILEIYTKQHTYQQYVSPQMVYQHKSDSLIYTGQLKLLID